jgi:hypothetical protein
MTMPRNNWYSGGLAGDFGQMGVPDSGFDNGDFSDFGTGGPILAPPPPPMPDVPSPGTVDGPATGDHETGMDGKKAMLYGGLALGALALFAIL